MSIAKQAMCLLALSLCLTAAVGPLRADDPSLPPSPFSSPPPIPPIPPPASRHDLPADDPCRPIALPAPASEPASQPASLPVPVSQPNKKNQDRTAQPWPLPTNRLTDESINLLKVYEVDLNAKPPARVQVPPQVIDAILRDYAHRPEVPKGRLEQQRLRTRSDREKLALLFELRAKELYGQVTVYGHPPSMERFRLKIHRDLVLSYCGTSQCHGSVGLDTQFDPPMTRPLGGYFVFRQHPTDDATAYTNYLILAQFPESDRGLRMIHDARPEHSLLLQYALATEEAAYPHPKVRSWRPYFDSPRSSDFQMAVQWIKMLQSRSYPIDYQPRFESVPPASPSAQPPARDE